jgi:hypothetical protein
MMTLVSVQSCFRILRVKVIEESMANWWICATTREQTWNFRLGEIAVLCVLQEVSALSCVFRGTFALKQPITSTRSGKNDMVSN